LGRVGITVVVVLATRTTVVVIVETRSIVFVIEFMPSPGSL